MIYTFESQVKRNAGKKIEPMSISSPQGKSASGEAYNPMVADGVMMRQQDIVQQQDMMIADIELGVDRLHNKVECY